MGRRTGTVEFRQVEGLEQRLLPSLEEALVARSTLFEAIQRIGSEVVQRLFEEDAVRVVGPLGKHQPGRRAVRWGSTVGEFPLAGRKVSLRRPRVRGVEGGEVTLPLVEHFRSADPLGERVMEQILLGVPTRGYGRSLAPAPPAIPSRGTSKSAASRHVVRMTRKGLKDLLSRPLGELDLLAVFIDGIRIGGRVVLVALGVDGKGHKHPLGIVEGTTENTTACCELLQDLIDRGLRAAGRLLFVIDGGKGLKRAISDVFGDNALIQRCHVHKLRNLREHLPEKKQASILREMREAWNTASADSARRKLQSIATWLERSGEDTAARSLREGLEETLTVLKLGLPRTLSRSLATTNAVENLMRSIRRTTRNVHRWRRGDMVRRWVGLALVEAGQRFHRIRGHADLKHLRVALQPKLNADSAMESVAA